MIKKLLCLMLAISLVFAIVSVVSAEEPQITFSYETSEFDTFVLDEDEGISYDNTVEIKVIMKGADLTEKGVCGIGPFILKWDKKLADLVATKTSLIESHSGLNAKAGISSAAYATATPLTKNSAVIGRLYFKLLDGAEQLNNKLVIKVEETEKTLVGYNDDTKYTFAFDESIEIAIPNGVAPTESPEEPEDDEEVTTPPTGGDPLAPVGPTEGEGNNPVSRPSTGTTTEPEESETSGTPLKPLITMILTINDCIMKVNNNTLINDVAPIIVSERTMLPIRVVCQEFGAKVEWDDTLRKVTVTGFGKVIEIFVDSEKAYVNGEEQILDSKAFIQNDRTYVPLRFVMENLEAKVDWNEELYQVTISK